MKILKFNLVGLTIVPVIPSAIILPILSAHEIKTSVNGEIVKAVNADVNFDVYRTRFTAVQAVQEK